MRTRIRAAKATGLRNLPFGRWRRNAAWLELILAAQDLVCWAQALLLVSDLARAEPKTLRYRLLHVAAGVTRDARRIILRLQASWPWRSPGRGPCRCAANPPRATPTVCPPRQGHATLPGQPPEGVPQPHGSARSHQTRPRAPLIPPDPPARPPTAPT
jgi:hypothetical protein